MLAEKSYSVEHEALLQQVETRLASGYQMDRLMSITGIRRDYVDALLQRQSPTSFRRQEDIAVSIAKLQAWLDEENSKDVAIHDGLAVTPTFKRIQGIMGLAHSQGKVIAITGEVGVGKSQAAKAYVREHPRGYKRPGAVRVEFTKTDNKPVAALEAILEAMRGAQGTAYRNGQLMTAIGAAYMPGDLLILDECNYLKDAADIVRDLHSRYGIPIVMIGNPDFNRDVWGKNGRETSYSALVNRTPRFDFPVTTEEDVDAWLVWKGLTGRAVREAAVKIATRPGQNGGLRTLDEVVEYVCLLHPGKPLDDTLLLGIASQIGRPVIDRRARQ